MTTTPYPQIAAAFKTQLETLYPREVFRGVAMDRAPMQYFALTGVEQGINDWATMRAGRKPREGSFQLRLIIVVHRGGSDSVAAEDEALERMGAVEDLIAENPGLGLAIPSLRMIVDEWEMDVFQSGERNGWTAWLEMKVRASFRLT